MKELSDKYEVHRKKNEPLREFMARLTLGIVQQIGDPLHALELTTGKDYHDFNDEENAASFLLLQANRAFSESKNISNRDTYRDMPYRYFQDVVFENGFDRVMKYDFFDTHEKERKEEFSIWARKDLGMLLTSESYYGKTQINSFCLYYELPTVIDGRELNQEENEQFWQLTYGTGSGPCLDERKVYLARAFNYGNLDGLISHVRGIARGPVKPNVPWKFYKKHHLWLCDYSETNARQEHEEINKRKISQLPKDVQEMIGFV